MATYVNNLRLKEITTGDEDGTWGTSTNTNLELITDGFSYGTKEIAADANETFTMPDATADATRSLYLKFTSAVSLTATREITLGPNTVSKTWIIENATTGSQIITIKQGSGATVDVANGSKVMVVTDGAGAGAAVLNANPTEVGGSVTSVDVSGGTTGLTTSGGPVTTSGTITLAGTLAVANGGTGGTTSTGTGAVVLSTSPTLVTPALGTPASGTLTNATGLPPAGVVGTAAILGANTFTGLQTLSTGADIASATAIDLTAATGNTVVITGTTETTSLTMTAGQQMVLLPSGAWPMTYHPTTMNINGGASYTCAAGDRILAVKDLAGVIRVSVIKQDGTAVAPGGFSALSVITTTGSFTVPDGKSLLKITAVGGGASGATNGASNRNGGGGGGGGAAIVYVSVSAGDTVSITVGAGGAAPTAGTYTNGISGGTTTVTYAAANIAVATGGSGGSSSNGPGGDGGIGTTGDVLLSGSGGGAAQYDPSDYLMTGFGGASGLGTGGAASAAMSNPTHIDGRNYGGGGMGCNGTNAAGSGGDGVVIIEY